MKSPRGSDTSVVALPRGRWKRHRSGRLSDSSMHSTCSTLSSRTEFFAAQLSDLPRQLAAPSVDAGFDGALRKLQRAGDLVIGALLNVAHQHRGAKRRRQRGHRLAEQFHAVALLERGNLARRAD